MNDDLTPEELASAYLDGEVSEAERARVESSPELMALVARYRQVSDAVAEPVPIPSTLRRDAAIAAALAASPKPATGGGAGVSSLAARRARRWPEGSTIAGAAAAIVLLVGAVGIVSQLGGGSDDDDATSTEAVGVEEDEAATDGAATEAPTEEAAGEATEEATEAPAEEATEEAAEAPAEEAADEAAGEATEEATEEARPAAAAAYLGSVETRRELDLAISGFAANGQPTAAGGVDGPTEPPQCSEPAAVLAADVAITAVGRITFQGRVLEIYLLDTPSTTPDFLALEVPDCTEFTG